MSRLLAYKRIWFYSFYWIIFKYLYSRKINVMQTTFCSKPACDVCVWVTERERESVSQCVEVVIPVTEAHKDVNTHTNTMPLQCWLMAWLPGTLPVCVCVYVYVCVLKSKQWMCKAPQLQERQWSRKRSEQCLTSCKKSKSLYEEGERERERT